MKAIVIEKPGYVVVQEVNDPDPAPDEVLLRPAVGGICGTDVHILDGDFLGNYPVIPCHEFSAKIIQAGHAVTHVAVGDSVAVDPNIRCGRCPRCLDGEVNLCEHYEATGVTRPGGFAELVSVPAKNVHVFSGCSFSSAAFAEPLACVLYGQNRLEIAPGTSVLIWGAGAIGLLHLQVCTRLRGAEVVVVDQDPKRIAKAMELGAAKAIRYDDSIEKTLVKLKPKGWDIAIEATGSPSLLNTMFRYLRRGGQALVFGVYPRGASLSIEAFDVFLNDWTIRGSFTYRHEFARAVRILSSGLIDAEPLVSMQIPLEEVPVMLNRLVKGDRLGKIHVRMNV